MCDEMRNRQEMKTNNFFMTANVGTTAGVKIMERMCLRWWEKSALQNRKNLIESEGNTLCIESSRERTKPIRRVTHIDLVSIMDLVN